MEERRIPLPPAVAAIYHATERLNAEFPLRSFTQTATWSGIWEKSLQPRNLG
jgi:hypothetical protein